MAPAVERRQKRLPPGFKTVVGNITFSTSSTEIMLVPDATPDDQGDLTDEQAIAESRTILANPDAHEWVPWKASESRLNA